MAWSYPVPARKSWSIRDSFWRKYIPGTSRRYARGFHYAIDIDGVTGDRVNAIRDAVIVFKGVKAGLEALGKQVLLRYRRKDGTYVYARYCHLKSVTSKAVGTKVLKGSKIGELGNTGLGQPGTKGDHLHFELSTSKEWTRVSALENAFPALMEAKAA